MKKILLAYLFALPLSFIAQDIDQGLVANWLFDNEEEVIDQSPSQIEGILEGGVLTEDRFGVENEAMFFDGQTDYVTTEDALDEITTVDDATFSISLWHRTSDVIPNLSPLICKYGHTGCGDPHRQWALLIANGEGIRFYFASTPDAENYRSMSTIEAVCQEPNTWYHIVATFDGSTDTNDGLDRVQIYVDNVLQPDTINFNPGELGETINDADAPIGMMAYVGVDGDQCGDFNAPGALDDVRIYDRVITPTEVHLLYDGTVGVDENAFASSISISPNVITDGMLNLMSNKVYTDLRVEVLSTTGALMQRNQLSQLNGATSLQLTNLAAGTYLVRIASQDGGVAVKRVVLQ